MSSPRITESTLSDQFSQLITGPLRSVEHSLGSEGPVIIILDALDECGNQTSRYELLSVLEKQLGDLPRFVRIFVTSRRELDIEGMMKTLGSKVYGRDMGNAREVNEDLTIFFQHQLGNYPKVA